MQFSQKCSGQLDVEMIDLISFNPENQISVLFFLDFPEQSFSV